MTEAIVSCVISARAQYLIVFSASHGWYLRYGRSSVLEIDRCCVTELRPSMGILIMTRNVRVQDL